MELFSILFMFSYFSFISSCPDKCRCSSRDKIVVCIHASLNQVPSDIPLTVTDLNLSNNLIKSLSANSFNGLVQLKTLRLNNNEMKHIDKNAFTGLQSLRHIFLVNNDLSDLHNETFKGLPNLLHVYLSQNEFQKIPKLLSYTITKLLLDSNRVSSSIIDESFLSCAKLQTIILTKNDIIEINENDFTNLKNSQISSLMLKMNKLTKIHKSAFVPVRNTLRTLELEGNELLGSVVIENALNAFDGSTSMHFLDLRRTGLTYISDKFFQPFTNSKLQRLDLSSNSQLHNISSDAFNGLTRVQFLHLNSCQTDNHEIRFSAMSLLRELHIAHNRLTICPSRLPGSLRILYLQSNSIIGIHKNDFKSLSLLQQLWLNGNSISFIEMNSFSDLSSLELLDLSYNRLKNIGGNIFVSMNRLSVLNLRKQESCLEKISPRNAFILNNLSSLNLAENCIDTNRLNFGLFRQLQRLTNLSLASNHLKYIKENTFDGCSSLEFIDLSKNTLTGWSSKTFKPLVKSLVFLDLSFNYLTNISSISGIDNYLPYFTGIQYLYVDNNFWNCTCQNVGWLLTYKSVIKRSYQVQCHYPSTGRLMELMDTSTNCLVQSYQPKRQITDYVRSNVKVSIIIGTVLLFIVMIVSISIYYKRNWFKRQYNSLLISCRYAPFKSESYSVFENNPHNPLITENSENFPSGHLAFTNPMIDDILTGCNSEINEINEIVNDNGADSNDISNILEKLSKAEKELIDFDIVLLSDQNLDDDGDRKILIKLIRSFDNIEDLKAAYYSDCLVIDHSVCLSINGLKEILIKRLNMKNFIIYQREDETCNLPNITRYYEYDRTNLIRVLYNLVE